MGYAQGFELESEAMHEDFAYGVNWFYSEVRLHFE
jgi:hypothetical protein